MSERLVSDMPAAPSPPLGSALKAALDSMEATPTRRPLREFAWFVGLGVPFVALVVAAMGLRRDIGSLSPPQLAGVTMIWFASFAACAYLTFVPADKQVVPRSRQIWQVVAASLLLLVALGIFASHEFAGAGLTYEVTPGAVLARGKGCSMMGFAAGIVPGIIALLCLRRFIPVGRVSMGVGLGAAGGALAGIFLFLHCPISERFHQGLAHTSGIATAAICVAAASWLLLRER